MLSAYFVGRIAANVIPNKLTEALGRGASFAFREGWGARDDVSFLSVKTALPYEGT